MLYEEFSQYPEAEPLYKGLIKGYRAPNGDIFYVEPAFITALRVYKDKIPEAYDSMLKEIYRRIEEHGKIIFTPNFEMWNDGPEGYLFVEPEDIATHLGIYLSDDNRPSDYGD